jgi:hypothetical protein
VTLDFSAALLAQHCFAHHFSAPLLVCRYRRTVLSRPALVEQKFPNRDDDKNGQSNAIPDDTGFVDFFLFHHTILPLRPGNLALLRLQPQA